MGFADRVDAMYGRMAVAFTELDDMTSSMLRSYCVICAQIDDLNERIEDEGYFVDTPKGPKENPAVNTVHKLNADKARYFAPLKRYLAKDREGALDKAMEDFMAE